ncbi:MAG: hypothetical protein FWF51_04845 [Chitinivibrionia bacterium]|jgi:hypothetical protein|nr:hypothetical protein [Chitinivibrionia bacterium]
MENLGYLSYDVTLTKNRFVMPADLRPAFQGQGKFVIFSDKMTRTLIITDKKTFDESCKELDMDVLITLNAREYDPREDSQARGSFSASQMNLLGNPEEVIFSALDKCIVVQNPETVVDNTESVEKQIKDVKKIILGR